MLFIQALFIGFCIAAPVGPIGTLCIERGLAHGFRAAFATGLGAATADALYGLCGAFGLAVAVRALPGLSLALQAGGAVFLLVLGVRIVRAPPPAGAAAVRGGHAFASTFLLTAASPMTMLSFVAVFSALGVDPARGYAATAALMTAGVFLGSALWWLMLSGAAAALRSRLADAYTRRLTRASGLLICAFGCWQGAQACPGWRA